MYFKTYSIINMEKSLCTSDPPKLISPYKPSLPTDLHDCKTHSDLVLIMAFQYNVSTDQFRIVFDKERITIKFMLFHLANGKKCYSEAPWDVNQHENR